jgi:hypothetical protein
MVAGLYYSETMGLPWHAAGGHAFAGENARARHMLAWLRQERRYAAAVEAEELARYRGDRGVAVALAMAADTRHDKERRRFYRLVAAIARRRLAALQGLDWAAPLDMAGGRARPASQGR